MPEFFLELFSEEIPARMQRDAAAQLEKICTAALQTLGIHSTKTFYGPRRIALSAVVNAETSAKTIEERGPRETAPEAALKGFLGKHGAAREDVVIEGGYFVLRRAVASVPAASFVLHELPAALAKFSWPKSMRWGQGGDFTWVRPLRRVVCLLDGEVVPITVGPIPAGRETEGHRMVDGAISVSGVDDWLDKLRGHHVIADQDERRQKIIRGIAEAASTIGLTVAEDEGLVDEVTGLVEWPVPLIGRIDEQFMSLPPEVRELSMKVNQRYFALRDADGKPAPYFAFVANLEAPDGGVAIIAGNERVLRARLSDARHFWDIDVKIPLSELLPKLENVIFHEKLGTQADRVKRLKDGVFRIGSQFPNYEQLKSDLSQRAAQLSKCDLVTGMVGEFPELQGIIGAYYALENGEAEEVADALRMQYSPKGPKDSVPRNPVAIYLALADKFDQIVGFFDVGERPTGSGDPFALRRAALGIIRIVFENELDFNIRTPIHDALEAIRNSPATRVSDIKVEDEIYDFIMDRLVVRLRNEGKRFDVLRAIIADRKVGYILRISKCVDLMAEFLKTEAGISVMASYRRVANILKIELAKSDIGSFSVNESLFQHLEESELFRSIEALPVAIMLGGHQNGILSVDHFANTLAALEILSAPINAFLDKASVNTPEPELRLNRLRLLAQLRDTMHQIADFSKIVG